MCVCACVYLCVCVRMHVCSCVSVIRVCVHVHVHALGEGDVMKHIAQQVSKSAGTGKHIMKLDLTLQVIWSR